MNALTKIKLFNNYDYVVNDLYKTDGETPITDIEGSTALLLTNGTSWELIDGAWSQIETELDLSINSNFYPFLMSVCNSINNHFVTVDYSHCYEKAVFSIDSTANTVKITIDDDHVIEVIEDDFVIVVNAISENLTKVTTVVDTTDERSITVDGTSFTPRVTGKEEKIDVLHISFPIEFLETVYAMFAYDLFERDSKQLKQERLGNYTVSNFTPTELIGDGSYPKHLLEKLKYWQIILT